MAKMKIILIHFSFLFASIWPTGGASLTLEDKVKQLAKNYEIIMAKNDQLEAKVIALQSKVEQQDVLAEKFALALQNAELRISQLTVKNVLPRTCREARAADPTLSSGMYWIDPDGQGVGDSPIYVHCNMASGSTFIPHDSESSIDVGHCAGPGCYSRAINYNASSRQMSALAQLSAECQQSIKYDCNFAPLEFNVISYSFWNDKNGNSKTFWAGSNTAIHTCQCGLAGNCADPSLKCNCDSMAPVPLTDDGIITDKNVLPITRLNYGRTQLETSSGVHTLGRFECSGQVAVSGMPTSCQDLWVMGHILSGFYSVKGNKMVESVYCDFAKLPTDAGFQRWIGFEDVKSSPIYFFVSRDAQFSLINVPVPFDVVQLNIGGAMKQSTGIFTAPRAGIYFFSASGIARFPTSSTLVTLWIYLMKNGVSIAHGLADESNTSGEEYATFSLQSTLSLQVGDEIWLQIPVLSSGAELHGHRYSHFNGILVEEDISQLFLSL